VATERISGSIRPDQQPGRRATHPDGRRGRADRIKLDRLGRNAMDVRTTVEGLAEHVARVHCLALGRVDLTGTGSRMTM
jgi:putative DNA-invertase from lambdoid prophage Rac